MSISLTLINKTGKKRKVGEVVLAFNRALNDNYTMSEMEGYVTNQGRSCLSVLFQAEGFKSKKQSDIIIQKIGNQDHNIVLIKKTIEPEKMEDFLEILGDASSPFVVLELTKMISGLEIRPPWTLSDVQLVFPVGGIGKYFVKTYDSPYKDDTKGIEFAKDFPNKDQSEIATAYYDKFVKEGNIQGLTNSEESGMHHFTTMVTLEGEKLRFTFMQNQMRIARYFFEPDIMFCSNDAVARSVRRALYPNQDISMKGSLRFYKITI